MEDKTISKSIKLQVIHSLNIEKIYNPRDGRKAKCPAWLVFSSTPFGNYHGFSSVFQFLLKGFWPLLPFKSLPALRGSWSVLHTASFRSGDTLLLLHSPSHTTLKLIAAKASYLNLIGPQDLVCPCLEDLPYLPLWKFMSCGGWKILLKVFLGYSSQSSQPCLAHRSSSVS